MASQGPDKRICSGCNAILAANLRYCIYCYRPVSGERVARVHVEAARAIDTTRRADPTRVFLPEEHEAIKRRARKRKRLLVAGAIAFAVAIASLVSFNYLNRRWQESEKAMARERMARRELRLMADALERFRTDVGRYPTTLEGITSLARKPFIRDFRAGEPQSLWLGPYLDSVPEVDPWGNDYVYEATGGGQEFELFSYGPEGETGSGSQLQVTSSDPPTD
ncbi:MAG TPA: type II secretion system protein GspG [Blastocatellia bacterium]|nr:type II secretion system protein GspG [Blastocatellia bacterium]